MKNKSILLAAAVILFAGKCFSIDSPTIGGDVAFKSKFVWRGIGFNEGNVLWPDVWISWQGFTITGFLSLDLETNTTYRYNYQSQLTDFDITVDYTKQMGKATLSAGYNQYIFPGYDNIYKPVSEVYAKLSGSFFIIPSISVYCDIMKDYMNENKRITGFYLSPKISRAVTLGNTTNTIAVSAGYGTKYHNKFFVGKDADGATDITASLTSLFNFSEPLGNYASCTADLNYSIIPDNGLAELYGVYRQHIYFGVTINLFKKLGSK
jgi:hypothetical protein